MRAFAGVALAVILAGCSSAPTETTPSAPPEPPPVSQPPPDPARADQCHAADYQSLVGKPRSEIPIPIDPNKQRVACTTCPVTMDFSPERLNFLFDATTGLIKEVRCG